jgi:hypothetical protein
MRNLAALLTSFLFTSVALLPAGASIIAEYNGAASAVTVGTSTPLSAFSPTTLDPNLNATTLAANAPAKVGGTFIVISGNPSGTDTNIQKMDVAGPNAFGTESVKYFEYTPNNGSGVANVYQSTTETQAKSVGDYISFTLTPAAGYALDISSVAFRVAQLTGNNTAARGFSLATSADSSDFSTDLAMDGQISGFRATTGGFEAFSIDTSAMSQYANITTSVEFRFYGWTPSNGQGIGFDKFTINGSLVPVVVPEPAPASLVAFGGLGIAWLNRRSRSKR